MELAKQNILVVDDEPQVLVALEDILSDEFTVLKTESAEQALRVAQEEPDIAVVLSDQRMPNMNGDELLAKMSGSSEASRILVTGYADLSAVVRAVNDGRIFAYVTKPWNPQDLRLMVRRAAEHFRLAKELASERQLLHDLMDNVPDGIYFKDRQLRFLRANRAFAGAVESGGPANLVGRRLGEIVTDSGKGEVESSEAEERRILAQGVPEQDVLREYQRAGSKRWISETKAPIRNPGGEVIGLVGIARDVTERIQTQDRMRRLEQQLLQSQKMDAIGQLAGGIAHDFNNILSVITGCGELVLQDLPDNDAKREDLVELLAASQRAAALTRQLLAFSRRQVVKPEMLEFNAVVANVEKMLRRVIGEDIDLRTVLAPGLGAVLADPNQIEMVLLNLTVNARDAMPEGGKLSIETSEVVVDQRMADEQHDLAPGTFVLLSVTDTGVGMDAATQKRIFEPFFTTKAVGKGTGLGLATVYGIVQQCGGHIVVESQVGRGTRFSVYFPRAAGAVSSPPLKRGVVRGSQKSATVLLVEDEDAVRHVTARILREQGYTVLEARRAGEARTLAEKHAGTIDVLLIDVVMPEISGPKLAEELSASAPSLRVLLMSGYSGGLMQEAATASGTPYLEKPFTPNALSKKLREVLGEPG
jgi:PAS domain S-box-containing protein